MTEIKKSVLITGSSTGIGLDAAIKLADQGFKVYAGVRTAQDQKRLREISDNIVPIILDVTSEAQIQDAYQLISSQQTSSFSLVNNAGIAVAGPFESLTVSDFRRQFEVNFFGLIQVTKAFLPLIRKNRGRIINISSVSGLSSSPFLGAYSASKYALEALSDALRWELAPTGVKVVIVEPGPIATPIWKKGMGAEQDMMGALPEDLKPTYELAVQRFSKLIQTIEASALPVGKVSEAIVKALTAKNPPVRMMVAAMARKGQYRLTKHLPEKWVDKLMEKVLFK